MKKVFLKWLLTIALLLPCLLTMAYATNPTVIASGYCGGEGDGTNLTWALYDDGQLTIEGTGMMADFASFSETPWYNNRSSIKQVVIKKGVSSIGNFAFAYCRSLSEVDIPDSVTTINAQAFYYCKSLYSVSIPASVSVIEDDAFRQCESAISYTVDIENSWFTSVGGVLFDKECLTLLQYPAGMENKIFEVPTTVTEIGNFAFDGCWSLECIVFQGNAPTINEYSFFNCGGAVYYPAENKTWTEEIIQSFKNKITLYADAYSGSCGQNATWKLNMLTNILTIAGSGDMTDFSSAQDVPWYDYRRFANSIVIQDGITSIGDTVFQEHNQLSSVTIPDSVVSIGSFAFMGCTALTRITIPNSVVLIEGGAFQSSGLTIVHIPGSVKTVKGAAFMWCNALTHVTIGKGVGSFEEAAFFGCPLTEITIPASVKNIGEAAFLECRELSSIEFCGDAPFLGADALPNSELTIFCHEGFSGWKDSEDYDAVSETWYGYPLVVIPTPSTITDTGRSISLGDQIYINQYVTVSGFDDIDVASKGGLLIWNSPVTEEDALYGTADTTQKGLIAYGDEYTQRTLGISAKNYADELYLRIYIEVADGEYVYGPLTEYSVQDYCEHKINTEGYTADLKKTCAALLHYGAMAQRYFNYNTEDLANANILEVYPAPAWMTED